MAALQDEVQRGGQERVAEERTDIEGFAQTAGLGAFLEGKRRQAEEVTGRRAWVELGALKADAELAQPRLVDLEYVHFNVDLAGQIHFQPVDDLALGRKERAG